MSFLIEKDESAATRLVVPFRIFKSNGTAPDTGSSASSVKLSWGGTSMATATNKISAVSAGAGEYYLLLAASEISILGNIRGWFDQGDFPQPLFTVQVVNSNPFSNFSNIAAKAYSGVTVGAGDYAAKDMTSKLTVGTGSIAAGTYSAVTIQGLSSVQSADVQQILGSAPYALRLGSHLSSVVTGKVVAGVSLTTSFTADVSCTTNDNYNGRVLIFTDPGTSGLYGQATSINSVGGFVGFSNTSSLFNVAALTNAPPANSTFLIV
jgi:hypothetical protein